MSSAPGDEPLLIGALDAEGLPLAGVGFVVIAEDHATSRVRAATSEWGVAEVALPGEASARWRVELDDARFVTADLPVTTGRHTGRVSARLLPSDLENLTEEERERYVVLWAQLVARPVDDSPPQTPTPWRLSAFLGGNTREVDPPDPNAGAAEPPADPAGRPRPATEYLRATVNDGAGAPVAGARVYVFYFDEERGGIYVGDTGRTDAQGRVRFVHAPAETLYRIEATTDDGRRGRSGIARTPATGRPMPHVPVVLRYPESIISGVLVDGSTPVANALVQTTTFDSNANALRTLTDDHGYFALGPLDPGEVPLEIIRGGEEGSSTLRVVLGTGETEYLVPLHLLRELGAEAEP